MSKNKPLDHPLQEPPKLLLSVEEAAECLSVGRTLVFSLIKSRALKACKIGRRTLISCTELEAFRTRLEKGQSR